MKAIFCAAVISLCCTFALGQAQYKVLWSFGGAPGDGSDPLSGLILDHHGNLYGTTFIGGANGCGTVFRITAPAQESVLYSFGSEPNHADGCGPAAGLIQDKNGNLFGTTTIGGTGTSCQFGCGVVFETTP